MAEKKHKLGHSQSSVVASVIDQEFVAVTESKNASDSKEEFDFLWQELKTQTNSVSSTSCAQLLARFAEQGVLNSSEVLATLLSSVPEAKDISGLVAAIYSVLAAFPEKSNSFAISKRQHPLIALLRSAPDRTEHLIAVQLQNAIHSRQRLDVFLPAILFLFCDPNYNPHLAPARSIVSTALLQSQTRQTEQILESFVNKWLYLEDAVSFCNNVYTVSLHTKAIGSSLPYLCSLAKKSLEHGLDPTYLLSKAKSSVIMNIQESWSVNVALILLADMLDKAAFGYLESIAETAWQIVEKSTEVSRGVLGSLTYAILPHLSNKMKVTPQLAGFCVPIVSRFYELTANEKTRETLSKSLLSETLSAKFTWDSNIQRANFVLRSIAKSKDLTNAPLLRSWMERLTSCEFQSLSKRNSLVASVLLNNSDQNILEDCLEVMIKMVVEEKSLAPKMLTLVLHKISRLSQKAFNENEVAIHKLARVLPKLAVDKCCIAPILSVIGSFKFKPELTPLRLSLLQDLWSVEPRTYSQLQKGLEQEVHTNQDLIAKASVIKAVCEKKPEIGGDLLKPMSDLLNRCSAPEEADVCIFAIDGIASLCSHGIIDLVTTIKVLSPKLKADPRPSVVAAFFKLLAIIPSFNLESDEYVLFIQTYLTYLWSVAYPSHQSEIEQALRIAALEAISKFGLDYHTLDMLPEKVRPPAMLEPEPEADDEARQVPGECWLSLRSFDQNSDINKAYEERVLKIFLAEEIASLPRSAFTLSKGMRERGEEPASYAYLPSNSILRAILDKCLTASRSSGSDKTNIAGYFSLLSQIKKLPPFDWTLVKPLLPILNRRDFVEIIAKHSGDSRSCKLILENLFNEWSMPEIAKDVVPCLKHFGPNIRLDLVEPAVRNAVELWLVSAMRDTEACQPFIDLLRSFVSILDDDSFPSGLRDSIKEILKGVVLSLPADEDSLLWSEFKQIIAEKPNWFIESQAIGSQQLEDNDSLYKYLSIVTAISEFKTYDSPLHLLNDAIERESRHQDNNMTRYDFVLTTILKTVSKTRISCKQVKTLNIWTARIHFS